MAAGLGVVTGCAVWLRILGLALVVGLMAAVRIASTLVAIGAFLPRGVLGCTPCITGGVVVIGVGFVGGVGGLEKIPNCGEELEILKSRLA